MGCEDHPQRIEAEQRVICRWWLLLQHVKGGTKETIFLQRLNEGCLINHTTAARVDQRCRWLHQCQRLGIDQMARRRHQWHME